MDRAVFVSAGKHAERFDIIGTLPNESFENVTGPFPCATARKSQSLQLSQPNIAFKFLQASSHNVVGKERLAAFQHSLAKKLIKCDGPRITRLIVRAPDADQRAGFDPALPELLKNCFGIATRDPDLFPASY
jgi:hypothetical protein